MKKVVILSVCLVSLLALWAYTNVNYSMRSIEKEAKNVLGTPLQTCCTDPMTGYFRNGRCETNEQDRGTHVVCAEMTQEFLDFTKLMGNDLITPRPEYRFPGLKAGDKWCLCALRWREAYLAGFAPPVVLERTNLKALQYIKLDALKKHESQQTEQAD